MATKKKEKKEALSLEGLLGKLQKEHGEKTVGYFEDTYLPPLQISTGSIELDEKMAGGWQRGRLHEVYGPEASGKSCLTYHGIAETQKAGGIAVYVDAEHAFDPTFASNFGVDCEKLILVKPDSGEQAFDMILEFIDTNEVDMIVIDSVAAMIPQAEIEADQKQQLPGLHARMMGKGVKSIVPRAAKSKVAVIFINQIREKIGVMFGCFSYHTRVLLADGTYEKIGKIVNNKLPVDVLCYDESGKIVSAPIIDWHNNGRTENFLKIKFEGSRNGQDFAVYTTPNHQFRTASGWIEAQRLAVGDSALGVGDFLLNEDQYKVALSQVLGDGNLRKTKRTTTLRFAHGEKQTQYAYFKSRILGDACTYSQHKSAVTFTLKASSDLIHVQDGPHLIPEMGLLGVSLWYLDDGHYKVAKQYGDGAMTISCTRWSLEQLEQGADELALLGIPRPVVQEGKGYYWCGTACANVQKALAPFAPKCMAYKFHFDLYYIMESYIYDRSNSTRTALTPRKVVAVETVPAPHKAPYRYDITVEGHHNYFVGASGSQVNVHNSPETTTGGNALKYYASVRLEVTAPKAGWILKDELRVGHKMRVKVVKNKVAGPANPIELPIMYFEGGIDFTAEIFQFAVAQGVIEKAGAWYSYNGERVGQGEDNALAFLKAHPEMLEDVKTTVLANRAS